VEDSSDLSIVGFAGRQAQTTSGEPLFLQNGTGVSITNSRAMPGTRVFWQLDKVHGRRILWTTICAAHCR